MSQSLWYRYILWGIFIVPALMFQSFYPMISHRTWEELAENLYRVGLSARTAPTTPPSKLVVVEVDQKTWDIFGWPIDRNVYINLLEKLKKNGHPWILSMLQFQATDKRTGDFRGRSSGRDQKLAQVINQYERYIGSGLSITPGAILDADQEEQLLPLVLLSSSGTVPKDIPQLPLNFTEARPFVEAQRSFGFGPRFGTESVVHCLQSYLNDAEHRGDFVVLSSLVWIAAYSMQKKVTTSTGAGWPRQGEKIPFPMQSNLKVAFKLCDAYPGIRTVDYMQLRGIERISLADIVSGTYKLSLADKVVLLASSDMRSYRGPGYESGPNSAVVKEHLLAARFLDQILSNKFIRRDPIKEQIQLGWLPLFLGLFLFILSFFASPLFLCVLTASLLMILMMVGLVYLGTNIFIIPIQSIVSVGLSQTCLLILQGYLHYYGFKRQILFTKKLNQSFSQCNTLEELQTATTRICKLEFKKSRIIFTDYDEGFYSASSKPQLAMELFATQKLTIDSTGSVVENSATHEIVTSALTSFNKQTMHALYSPMRPLIFQSKLAILTERSRLGTAVLDAEYHIFEGHFIADLVQILQKELCQHWNRIKLLADQRLLDYRILTEESRVKILCRFLTQVLVSKFNDSQTMDENLKLVLTPRVTRTALLQADIRGYTEFSNQMDPYDMVKVLQSYFHAVVNAAQMVAQVKLIGDCIFLFVEEGAETVNKTPTDIALELAQVLVKSTEERNKERLKNKENPIHFGIGIHYGEVVAGNLSSEECIDYTVIGPEVNFVARIEELTKAPKVSGVIGPNGVILSEQAFLNLKTHSKIKALHINLRKLKISVRSFPDIVTAYGIPANDLIVLETPSDTNFDLEPLKLAG